MLTSQRTSRSTTARPMFCIMPFCIMPFRIMPSCTLPLGMGAALTLLFGSLFFASPLQAQRTPIAVRVVTAIAPEDGTAAVDAGPVPASQPIAVTVRLTQTPERTAALDQLLAAQTTASSASYHKWLTPQQYAASYGATDDQFTSLTAWAQSQGLTLAAVSTGKTRITLSGSADQVQRAFAVSLHRYVLAGQVRYANANRPSVPQSIAPMIAGVSGLDDLQTAPNTFTAISLAGKATQLATTDADPLEAASAAIDANASPILTLNAQACAANISAADLDAYRSLFRQANAQGITVLASSACFSSDSRKAQTLTQPSPLLSLPEVTALTTTTTTPDSTLLLIEDRPGWQVATGLPSDTLRHQPDLTTASTAAFTQTITTLLQQTGTRQGNINSVLYSLATTPDLYTQPDSAAAGTWEPATGLGVVDLAVLAKVFPRATGTLATSTSLTSSNYAPNYGQPFTLTSRVLSPIYGSTAPSGNVTFAAASQGVLGTASIDSTGTATFVANTPLNVGVYNITATYGGDASYASSSNVTAVILTVSIVNAVVTASVSPVSNVPYGNTATVTGTVTLPTSSAAPSGTITAAFQGVTGASYSATLTPNPGGNSATANIAIPVPPPGTYQIQVTCAGNANFQCQTPYLTSFTSTKGNTAVAVTATPAAPQAGQPVTFTAVVSSSGNGPGPYSFSGTMTFYDNGRVIATAAVGSNQATASAALSGNITHTIVATYSGDANWNGSTSTPQSVNPTLLPATLTLSPNVSSALVGVNIVITATVTTTVANTVGPTGTVSFYDTYNGSIVQLGGLSGAVTLTPNGPNQSIARFTTTGLLAGGHSIYAIYNGDANFAPATSSTFPLSITDYVVVMNPQTLTLKAGQTGQVVVQLGLINGFSGTVSFGCTPPSGAETTCGFSPASLTGGGTTTMTIVTTAAKAKTSLRAHNSGPLGLGGRGGFRGLPLGAGSAVAMLLCFLLPRRNRTVPLLLTALLTLSLIPSLGCGLGGTAPADSSKPSTPTDPGTPLGTQIFTITTAGNDGSNTARHNYQYQVTIQ